MSPTLIEETPDASNSWDESGFASHALLKMKYIRHRKLGFILFESTVPHDELAARIGGREDVLSAGFVFTPAADFRCLGHSGTLNLGAAPSDGIDLRRRMAAF